MCMKFYLYFNSGALGCNRTNSNCVSGVIMAICTSYCYFCNSKTLI